MLTDAADAEETAHKLLERLQEPYPLNIQGHEEAPLKAAKIWCSKDKGKAWVDWMLNGKLPANDGSCKNPVAATKQFASEIGFNSTPRIIFDNGYTADQAVTAEQIMTAFNAKKP